MAPAGAVTVRIHETQDVTFSNGLRVPAGTPIWVPLCGVHNSVRPSDPKQRMLDFYTDVRLRSLPAGQTRSPHAIDRGR
jgi:hypothetical protein